MILVIILFLGTIYTIICVPRLLSPLAAKTQTSGAEGIKTSLRARAYTDGYSAYTADRSEHVYVCREWHWVLPSSMKGGFVMIPFTSTQAQKLDIGLL